MNTIKILLDRKGILQKQFALDIGVSQPTVSDWVHNKKDPREEKISKIAEYFEVSPDVILCKEPIDETTSVLTDAGPVGQVTTHTPEAIAILGAVDKMPVADRKKALELMKVVFTQYEDFFIGGD